MTNPPMSSDQLSLDFKTGAHDWPPNEKYPLNWHSNDHRTVEQELLKDIEASTSFLIVTGFSSLSKLIEVFGEREFNTLGDVRIVLGWEPVFRAKKKFQNVSLDKAVKEYWLRQNYSIIHGGAIINLIEKIEKGKITFKFRDKLHAKIYIGSTHAILGSANFSHNGLTKQEEANIRVSREEENSQYLAFSQIAENYYDLAKDFNVVILDILKRLIQNVTWQEALARAIAEVLEGQWIEGYEELQAKLNMGKLWPFQRRGIAQAIYILQERSNVLIADPTGSGKTKTCSAVILTLIEWLWQQGRQDKTNPLIICPPLVRRNWQREFSTFRKLINNQLSMGLLSNAKNWNKKLVEDCLDLANIIVVDEAHNYLNPDSKRSASLKQANADYMILATATPINKRVDDLLRVVELLDVDNLSPEDFGFYRQLRERPQRSERPIDKSHLERLAGFISQFTVRRTKEEINHDIARDPSLYAKPDGGHYKFPEQNCLTYPTHETVADRKLAEEITVLASSLHGFNYLRDIRLPDYYGSVPDDLEAYVSLRIRAAKALSGYMIRAALRSSNVALVEHVEGAKIAIDHFGFTSSKSGTGNILNKLQVFRGKLPKIGIPPGRLPTWMTDLEQYNEALNYDIDCYAKISELAKQMSGEREKGKVAELVRIQKNHRLVLAFDSTTITLDYFRSIFKKDYPSRKVMVVSGSTETAAAKMMELYGLDSAVKNEGCIALCSDKMSEGVNLQGASAVVLLDMPSVLRIAEQRIGRIERMDSIYPEIDAFWPDDSEEFSLNGDRKIFKIAELSETVLGGSNLKLPLELKQKLGSEGHFKNVETTSEIINEYKKNSAKSTDWEGINNSFQPLVELKEGKRAMIPSKTYEQFKDVKSTIKTGVSFIRSSRKWCFIATRGTEQRSPRWVFIDDRGEFLSEFPAICAELRRILLPGTKDTPWNQQLLEEFITKMQEHERELLPWKKRRALEVGEYILSKHLATERKSKGGPQDLTRIKLLQDALNQFQPIVGEDVIDYQNLAQIWIEKLQPILEKKREENKRNRKVFNFDSLKRDWRKVELDNTFLNRLIEDVHRATKIDRLIAACIIGVPGEGESTFD